MALPVELPDDLLPGSLCLSHSHDQPLSTTDLRKLEAAQRVREVTTNYVAAVNDDIIVVDSASGNVSVTLLPARAQRRLIVVRKVAANVVTLVAAGSDQIEGAASINLAGAWTTANLLALPGMWVRL